MVHAPPEEDPQNKQLSVGSGVHAICIRGDDDLYDLTAVERRAVRLADQVEACRREKCHVGQHDQGAVEPEWSGVVPDGEFGE